VSNNRKKGAIACTVRVWSRLQKAKESSKTYGGTKKVTIKKRRKSVVPPNSGGRKEATQKKRANKNW